MNKYSYISIMGNIDTKKIEKATTQFRILSDPTRLRILCLLMEEPNGMCVYEIAESVNISHSAASHQLSKLEAHDIVKSYREGQMICYEMCTNLQTQNLKKTIKGIIGD